MSQNSHDSSGGNGDGDQSEIMTEQGNPDERRYSGPLADQLHAWAAERKNGPNEAPEIYSTLDQFVSHQLERPFSTQELDQSVQDLSKTTIKNIPLTMAPELGEILVYARLDKDNSIKATESAFKSIQKCLGSTLNVCQHQSWISLDKHLMSWWGYQKNAGICLDPT